MIELPEAITLSRQITEHLKGKTIKAAIRGNSPHKFAFYSRTPEEYATILPTKRIGNARECGWAIIVDIEPNYLLVLGIGGERIILHQGPETLPKKYHLLLEFTDNTFLTVSVQGWGAAMILTEPEARDHPYIGFQRMSPICDQFTYDYFDSLLTAMEPNDSRSIKFFIVSEPGIHGIGNGYLQDILFRASIHPKRKAVELTETEKRSLYDAIQVTLRKAVDEGGRNSEVDLFGRAGNYSRLLDAKSVGKPCSECGELIQKIQFLGGACYFCPECQKLPS